MNSDNNQEMFPLVDEQEILQAPLPVANVTMAANYCIR